MTGDRDKVAVLFDIDDTLIITGGAGATSWRLAFEEPYGIHADIGQFTDAGMTDPEVGRLTFKAVIGRGPNAGSSPGPSSGGSTTSIARSRSRRITGYCPALSGCCRS